MGAGNHGVEGQGWQLADLVWIAQAGDVSVFRDGEEIATVSGDGSYTDHIGAKGGGSYVYKICTHATSDDCSAEVVATVSRTVKSATVSIMVIFDAGLAHPVPTDAFAPAR